MVVPRNNRRLVTKTLNSLNATGSELIKLNSTWQAALSAHGNYRDSEVPEAIPLRDFLSFAEVGTAARTRNTWICPLLRLLNTEFVPFWFKRRRY